MKRLVILLLVLAMTAVGAAACGSDDGSTDAAADTTDAPTAEAEPAEEEPTATPQSQDEAATATPTTEDADGGQEAEDAESDIAGDDATEDAATTEDGDDSASADAGVVDLTGVCPDPLVLQTDWFPSPEHGYAYQLIGDAGELDAENGVWSGPLLDTGIDLEIRAGGPYLGYQPGTTTMYVDRDIDLAYVSTDEAVAAYAAGFPTVAVLA